MQFLVSVFGVVLLMPMQSNAMDRSHADVADRDERLCAYARKVAAMQRVLSEHDEIDEQKRSLELIQASLPKDPTDATASMAWAAQAKRIIVDPLPLGATAGQQFVRAFYQLTFELYCMHVCWLLKKTIFQSGVMTDYENYFCLEPQRIGWRVVSGSARVAAACRHYEHCSLPIFEAEIVRYCRIDAVQLPSELVGLRYLDTNEVLAKAFCFEARAFVDYLLAWGSVHGSLPTVGLSWRGLRLWLGNACLRR